MQFANCNRFLIALGANLGGSPEKNAKAIHAAIGMIEARELSATITSDLWVTPAFPAGSGPDFVNACLQVEAALDPEAMLTLLHEIEATLGRVRRARWGARVIDIDLLAAGSLILPDLATVRHWMDLSPDEQRHVAPDRLILPHPRLHERGFVLVPLTQIAPEWEHPVLKTTVQALEQALDPGERAQIRRI
ncbi:MAG: 2-amino-4-hydroxy-6-hydroxymethyldihydropteridine diphosphokinase [Pararhodobacter sp.]|nr:2-amino-4-hydroxy-6-hydroxymethyldihydropteridine diphosphokinase [Pararhodobacter sp.]